MLEPNSSVVTQRDSPANRQPNPRARHTFFDTKSFEDREHIVKISFLNPDSIVGDMDFVMPSVSVAEI